MWHEILALIDEVPGWVFLAMLFGSLAAWLWGCYVLMTGG